MHLILLSGGSGKRLWPLSNDVRSKQFLQVLPTENGSQESMVQRVYRQLVTVGGWDSITVVAGEAQKDQLQLQLGEDVNIVIEPERRDTFPAIALACTYLHNKLDVGYNDNIVVIPVDPFVDEDYFRCVQTCSQVIGDEDNLLVLLGARPTTPSEKYGYIIPENPQQKISNVLQFKEKPTRDVAIQMIEQGALWNCGVFGLKLGYVLNILKNKYGIEQINYKSMYYNFSKLKKTSFDYEVVEHAQKIKSIRYDGQWKDLGTWETLTEEMASQSMGNTRVDSLCQNTHVINEQKIPVIAMGLTDIVVVASQDGILVAEKGETYRLKDFLQDFDQRPMYEEKLWGSYTVLDQAGYPDDMETVIKKVVLSAGQHINPIHHPFEQKIVTVLCGQGKVIINGKESIISAGDTVKILSNDSYDILATEDLQFTEIRFRKLSI